LFTFNSLHGILEDAPDLKHVAAGRGKDAV
jgi:hypothetical protein